MIGFFVRHRTAANLLMLVLIALGVLSVGDLRRETFPSFAARKVQVQVVWPGATPGEVEESICRRIEQAVQSTSGVVEIVSEARDSLGIVTVEMGKTSDSSVFLSDVKTEVEALDTLPDDAEAPRIDLIGREDPVVQLAVAGPMSPSHLREYCDQLEERLRREPDVSQITILGFSDRLLRVELREEQLRRYNLSVAAVGDAIAKQSVDLPLGAIETDERDLTVRLAEARKRPQALEDLVILGGAQGSEIRLAQLGRVVETFEKDEARIVLTYKNDAGEWTTARAGVLKVEKAREQDVLKVFDQVAAFAKREQAAAPPGVMLRLTNDVASVVQDRLRMLIENGLSGLVLIFLTLWLFFNIRYAFWVAMSLPISFLAAFFFFGPLGLTINMITMVGLLLALGLLMDDSLVIAENIASHAERGGRTDEAAIGGVSQIAVGIISSFLTTVVVFGPLTQLQGNIGEVLRSMPIVLILVMVVSLVEAFFILPNHLSHTRLDQPNAFRRAFERAFGAVTEAAAWAAGQAIRVRYVTVAAAVAALMFSVSLLVGGVLKFQPFPDIEGDQVEARVLLPAGTPLSRTEAVAEHIAAALRRVSDANPQQERTGPGKTEPRDLVELLRISYDTNVEAKEAGSHVVTVAADLLSTSVRQMRLDDLIEAWRLEIGDVTDIVSLSIKSPAIGPAGRAISVRLAGDDLVALDAAAVDLQRYLRQFRGVDNLSHDLRPGREELLLELRPGAYGNQVDARMLAQQVSAALRGLDVVDVQVGSASKTVQARLARVDRDVVDALSQLPIVLPSGEQAPLTALATVRTERGWSRIARIDGRRTVTIEGDVDSRYNNAGEVRAEMNREWVPTLAERFPGVALDLAGEAAETAETQASMQTAAMIGLLGVFFILSYQFGSYFEPLIVMAIIPLAMIGVVAGHMLMGYPLTMPSMMGLASLAGVVVNDSILLVAFLKENREQHPDESTVFAAAAASRARFRAIFLTSVTTVLGLLPLMFETSVQAQILIPLAISIVFGMLASTVLVLVVVPALYCIMDDFGLATLDADDPHAH